MHGMCATIFPIIDAQEEGANNGVHVMHHGARKIQPFKPDDIACFLASKHTIVNDYFKSTLQPLIEIDM